MSGFYRGKSCIFWDEMSEKSSEQLGVELIERLRDGIEIEVAAQFLALSPNLTVVEPRTGFTIFHMAAAVGRLDLIELFRTHAEPDFSKKDHRGRTIGDLAAIVAQDFQLVEHIYELEWASVNSGTK